MRARLFLRAPFAATIVAFFFVTPQILNAQTGEADVSAPTDATMSLPPGVTTQTMYPESNIPYVYPRSVWEGYEFSGGAWQPSDNLRKLMTWFPEADHQPPDYSTVDRIIVHDEGCMNPTSCIANAEKYPIQTIQNIFRSHAVTRNWGDIGYNYIIDRQGRIYEGRYGGNGVRGAHIYVNALCENLNVGSVGVLLLGDLRGAPMTQAQSDSLSRLVGWIGAVNSVDMSETGITTTTWHNPRTVSGSCDLTQGGFTGTLTASRLVSHGDVEQGNSDHFSLDTQRLAAKTFETSYQSYAYRTKTDSRAYGIRDGTLQDAASQDTTVATIEQSQLNLFPTAQNTTLPDGALVKSDTRPRVYVIQGGARRPIPTADLFATLGYQWNAIQTLTDRSLALMKLGSPLPYSDNTLVKGSGEPVYVFEGGLLHHVSSAALFSALKYAWSSVKTLLDQDIAQYQKGDPKLFSDGSLVKASAPRIYEVKGGTLHPVLSAALFTTLHFSWNAVQNLTDTELAQYTQDTPLPWPDGALVRQQGQDRVYLLQKGYRRWIKTVSVFQSLALQWSDVHEISSEELSLTPEAQAIASPSDLTLALQPVSPGGDASSSTPSVPESVSSNTTEPIVRVGLTTIGGEKHPGKIVTLSYDVGGTVKKNGIHVTVLAANQAYTITPQAGEVWRIEPSGNGIVTIATYSDPAYNGANDNQFRGMIEIAPATDGTLWIINELKIEEYLKGIAETVNGDPAEYSKAFAVAARSYAAYYVWKGGKRTGEPFTLRNTTADQWYKGYNFEVRAKDPVAAANATRGMIAVFNGNPILAAYSSGAPGPTLSACSLSQSFCENNVVKADFAYLAGGVNDPASTIFSYTACGGAVHCVGLDAAGARRMAQLGSPYSEILAHYYIGSTVVQRW